MFTARSCSALALAQIRFILPQPVALVDWWPKRVCGRLHIRAESLQLTNCNKMENCLHEGKRHQWLNGEALSRSTIAIVLRVSDDFHSGFIPYHRSAICTSLFSLLLRFSRAFAQFIAMHAPRSVAHSHRQRLSALAQTTFFLTFLGVRCCWRSSCWTRDSTQNQTSTLRPCFEIFYACFFFFEFRVFFCCCCCCNSYFCCSC